MLACKDAKAQADTSFASGLQGIGIEAELLQGGEVNNDLLKATGKAAGGIGNALEVKEGVSNVWDKILHGENLTPNDMVPIIVPLMPLGPIAQMGVFGLQNIDKLGAIVSTGVERLDPIPDAPDYLKEWEENAKRRNAELDARLAERNASWNAELERLRQTPAVKPACGSLEWQYQPGSAECAPEEDQPTPSARSGWRLTSFNASYINPPPITDECFNFSNSIEEVTKLEAQDLVSSLGCTLGNLSIINSGNAVFTYSCQRNSQSFTSGSFEIYMSDTKIRTIRREQNTHVGDMEEEAIYEPCDPKPDCSPEGQAAWRATHNGAPAYMCSNPL